MKPAGYENCYNAIMAAKLKRPHVYPSFTEFFDVAALDGIRSTYGVDLYSVCLNDATAAAERASESNLAWNIPGTAACDRIDELREYLENFPAGPISDAARHELERLENLTGARC